MVKIINIETTTQDQIQTELNTQIIIENVPFKILGIDINQTNVLEIPHITATETIQIIEIDNI